MDRIFCPNGARSRGTPLYLYVHVELLCFTSKLYTYMYYMYYTYVVVKLFAQQRFNHAYWHDSVVGDA